MLTKRYSAIFCGALMLLIVILACNAPASAVQPTGIGAAGQTRVAETVIGQLTLDYNSSIPPATPISQSPPDQPDNTDNLPDPNTQFTSTYTFTPTATFTFTPTFTNTPTITNTPIPCNWAQFIEDVNYPDSTEVTAGTTFEKKWRIKNTGTCQWTSGHKLAFAHGDRMEAPDSVAVTNGTIAPEATAVIAVTLKAPASAGTYVGYFKLKGPDGEQFDIQKTPNDEFWVKIVVKEDLPDLTVKGFDLQPDPMVQLTPVTAWFEVENKGNTATGAFKVEWYSGEGANPWCTLNHAGLAAHDFELLHCTHNAGYQSPYADIQNKIIVDPDDQVKESDEDNNERTKNVMVIQ